MAVCAHRKCKRPVTQAFDVGSWFRPRNDKELVHYEVCDEHASYFTGTFDRRASERVDDEMVPWRPTIPPSEGIPAGPLFPGTEPAGTSRQEADR